MLFMFDVTNCTDELNSLFQRFCLAGDLCPPYVLVPYLMGDLLRHRQFQDLVERKRI